MLDPIRSDSLLALYPQSKIVPRYIEGDALQKHTYEWKESMEDPGLRIFGRKTGRPRLGYEEERSHSSRNTSLIVLRIAISQVANGGPKSSQHVATAILKFFPTLPSLGAVLPYSNSTSSLSNHSHSIASVKRIRNDVIFEERFEHSNAKE